MDSEQFSQTSDDRAGRRRALDVVIASALAGVLPGRIAAQIDIASAGNGGIATASANGGTIVMGDINSGGNVGNAISVGNTTGSVWIDGGDVANSTSIGLTADGGTAIADASGGSYNLAFTS